MKKLLYPIAFALTTLIILYSCSAEEEDTTPPPSVQQPTPEPEPEPIQYTLNVTASEGGSVNNEGNYDQGAEVTITAIADEGYYFYAWKGLNEGAYDQSIDVIVDSNKSFSPIFLEKPIDFIENPNWERQGFLMPGWSSLGVYQQILDKDLATLKSINANFLSLISAGGNSVEFDYHIQHYGGINSSDMENINDINIIVPLSQMAKKLGLNVTVKSLLLTESHINSTVDVYDWSQIMPSNPNTFFENYTSTLSQLTQIIDENIVDKWLITNELVSLTTKEEFSQNWIELIRELKSKTNIPIGFNSRIAATEFFPIPYPNGIGLEATIIPEVVLNELDFIGLSLYKASYFSLDNYGVTTLNKTIYDELWRSSHHQVINGVNDDGSINWGPRNSSGWDLIQFIQDFIDSRNYDVYISEFGASNLGDLLQGQSGSNRDGYEENNELHKQYFLSTLNQLNSLTNLKGVFGYMWPITTEDINSGIYGDQSVRQFMIQNKPSLEAFRQYYRNE